MPRFTSLLVPAGLLWLSLYDVVNALALPDPSNWQTQSLTSKDVPSESARVLSTVDPLPMTPIASISQTGYPIDTIQPLNKEAVHPTSDFRIWTQNHRILLHLTSRSSTSDSSTDDGPAHSPGRAITGGVIGGLGLIALIGLIHYILRRRRERRDMEKLVKLFSPRQAGGATRASVQTQAEPPLMPARARARKSGWTPSFDIRTPHGTVPSSSARLPVDGPQAAASDVPSEEPIRALRHPTEVR
ncbi:hypothetical protein PENSPDRAFT_734764 [Peniophora sp. CONT]|nr:hypothetical protein PENSPDRAFT_734764 [Peniophora sp. CONT]